MSFQILLSKLILLFLFTNAFSLSSFSQDRSAKTRTIITELKLVEAQQSQYTSSLEFLKTKANAIDSIKIAEIEKQLTEEEITQKLISALDKLFTEEEINIIYAFMQTSVFEKVMDFENTNKILYEPFVDIETKLDSLRKNQNKRKSFPQYSFTPIPVDREDGFYETVNYDPSQENIYVQLKTSPGVSIDDILEVKKDYSYIYDIPEISVTFNEIGKQKLLLLTRNNIKKPIAIVINKHIVSMPIVNEEIAGGRLTISGNYSEVEIDVMIEMLKSDK